MLHAQCPNHRNALTPLIWQLDLHALLDPHPRRLHPQVEGGLVDVDDIGQRLVHEDPDDSLGELLLLVHQFYFPFGLRAIDNLGFPIGGPMLEIDLTDEPRRKLREL